MLTAVVLRFSPLEPSRHGLVKRHNLVLSEMMQKILNEEKCNSDIALMWALNAKNSLQNVHGFSIYQLAIGQNLKLTNTISEDPPLISANKCSSKVLVKNLKAIQAAREAFVKAENSARIRRALNHNIQSYSDAVYLTGDKVYYKRRSDRCWRGPAKVL